MPSPTPFPARRSGFTLTELLTVIAIIGLLAAILVPVLGRMRLTAARAVTTSNLRQIGTAMQLYMDDHKDKLPGPLNTGQYNTYNATDRRTLGHHLWSYFGAPEPGPTNKILPVIENPAHTRLRRKSPSPVFVVCKRIQEDDGTTPAGLADVNPWGYLNTGTGVESASIPAPRIPNRSRTWAVEDVDALHPLGIDASWNDSVPAQPVFGNVRMTLYFDWHVAATPVDRRQ
ncbi:hypothetical protein OPIT5_10950 [Opitutaceae bacterium TAV5]|nr:hypothetical protein OPIT5_10950 [Opitutaceae bacterium TAV5]